MSGTAVTREQFLADGWCRFELDPTLARWVAEIAPVAHASAAASENARWLRCGGTWFVGVNALPNAPDGALARGSPLAGRAVDFIRNDLGLTEFFWDRGQVSIVYPGYPRQMRTESAAAFRYRNRHDAAHIDGLKREGPQRRRYLRNFQEFIFGIPTAAVAADNSPPVVWEKSHVLVREALIERFAAVPPERWPQEDVTALYKALRRRIFRTCRRVVLTGMPGEAWLVHRLTLHGVAPWTRAAAETAAPRSVVYFRPETAARERWLRGP